MLIGRILVLFIICGIIVASLVHVVFRKRIFDGIDEMGGYNTVYARYLSTLLYLGLLLVTFLFWPLIVLIVGGFFVFRYFDGRQSA
jgi:hypothetical protein